MSLAVRIWRVLLWIGGSFVLPALWMLLHAQSDGVRFYRTIVLLALYFLASSLGVLAALFIQFGWRSARPLSWVAAIIQLLAFPVFTPLGIFGAVLLYRGALRRQVAPIPASSKAGAFWASVAGFAGLILSFEGMNQWAGALGYPDARLTSGFPFALAALPLHCVIHEAGHALAVMFIGGHIHHFRVGPLWWRQEAGRRWFQAGGGFAAGSVGWTPLSPHRLTRQRLIAVAGGPLANCCAVLAGLMIFPFLGELGLARQWPWAVTLIAIGALFAVMNLVPSYDGFQSSDGATIYGLMHDERFRLLSGIILRQGMSDSSPLRPRNWSREDLEWTLYLEDAAPFAAYRTDLLQFAMMHYLDSRDNEAAVRSAYQFRDLATSQPARCSANAFPEAVLTLALHGHDLASARELWALRPANQPVQFELAALIAAASVADQGQSAAIQRAWKCSGSYGSSGTLEYLRDQLRLVEAHSLTPVQASSVCPH